MSLINREGSRIILNKSYRLPAKILEYSERVAKKITQKQDYTITTDNEDGCVSKIKGLSELDFSKGSWLLLCRNRAFLPYFENLLIRQRQLFVSGGECSLFTLTQSE